MQTLGLLFLVPDSLVPNDLESHSCSKNLDLVENAVAVDGRLAEIELGRLHCEEDHTAAATAAAAAVEEIAAGNWQSYDYWEDEIVATIDWPC